MKLKNSNGDKTKKNQFVTKVELRQNLICDKIQIVKKKQIVTKFSCD